MGPLSKRQALECETATTPRTRCRCRCGGVYHGANRQLQFVLAEGDPHRYREADEIRAARNWRRRMRRREVRTGMADLFKPLESA
jgi:hypothetical protein